MRVTMENVAIGVMLFFVATIPFILYLVASRPPMPSLDERKLVLDCMLEVGWEVADEDATPKQQLEQSRAWCEDFVNQGRS